MRHPAPEFIFLAPKSTVSYSSLKPQKTEGGNSLCAQILPPQSDFQPEMGLETTSYSEGIKPHKSAEVQLPNGSFQHPALPSPSQQHPLHLPSCSVCWWGRGREGGAAGSQLQPGHRRTRLLLLLWYRLLKATCTLDTRGA